MIYYDKYADVPPETIDAFVHEREMGRLVTVNSAGHPHIGLSPSPTRATASRCT